MWDSVWADCNWQPATTRQIGHFSKRNKMMGISKACLMNTGLEQALDWLWISLGDGTGVTHILPFMPHDCFQVLTTCWKTLHHQLVDDSLGAMRTSSVPAAMKAARTFPFPSLKQSSFNAEHGRLGLFFTKHMMLNDTRVSTSTPLKRLDKNSQTTESGLYQMSMVLSEASTCACHMDGASKLKFAALLILLCGVERGIKRFAKSA